MCYWCDVTTESNELKQVHLREEILDNPRATTSIGDFDMSFGNGYLTIQMYMCVPIDPEKQPELIIGRYLKDKEGSLLDCPFEGTAIKKISYCPFCGKQLWDKDTGMQVINND